MINSIKDLENFIEDRSFKKIFILCGKKSFTISGANKILQKIKKKEVSIYYKTSKYPILEELITIIDNVKSFKHLKNKFNILRYKFAYQI